MKIDFKNGSDKQKAFASALVKRGVAELAGKPLIEGKTETQAAVCAWLGEKCCKDGAFDQELVLGVLVAQLKEWAAGKVIAELKASAVEGVRTLLDYCFASSEKAYSVAGVEGRRLRQRARQMRGVAASRECDLDWAEQARRMTAAKCRALGDEF